MFGELLLHFGIKEFATFVTATMIFAMTPGIDTVFVLNRAIGYDKHIGSMAALGVASGVLVHTVLAAVGLAAIVAKSAMLFSMIKYLGAAYLVYLGVMIIYHAIKNPTKLAIHSPSNTIPISAWQAYRSGLLTNVLNPKVALFFLAFFPQFIVATQVDNAAAYLLLGVVYAMISAVWLVALAMLAGTVLSKLLTSQKAKRYMDIGSGAVFVLMGAKVAVSD